MSQELEGRRVAEDQIKEKDHEIFKIKQENTNLNEHWHEEKEEIKLDLDMEISLRETLMKQNEDLTEELIEANQKLEKFNKSSTMLDEQIQTQRMKGDTSGLRYNTSKMGEPSDTKSNMHEGKTAPKAQKPTSKKVTNLFSLTVINQDILLMFVEANLMLILVIDLIIDMFPGDLKVIVIHAICMGIDQLNVDMKEEILHLT